MEKLFYEMQGKHSSSGAKQCEIARHALTLAGYKWEVGGGAMPRRWSGWGVDHNRGICLPSPLFYCPACKKLQMEIVSEDARESQ